jgi:hypothetical protein
LLRRLRVRLNQNLSSRPKPAGLGFFALWANVAQRLCQKFPMTLCRPELEAKETIYFQWFCEFKLSGMAEAK